MSPVQGAVGLAISVPDSAVLLFPSPREQAEPEHESSVQPHQPGSAEAWLRLKDLYICYLGDG